MRNVLALLAMLLCAPLPAHAAGSGVAPPGTAVIALAKASEPAPPTAPREVKAHIDLSTQTMEVWVDGWRRYTWPISSARKGYRTPTGSFQPYRMHRRYFSRKYDNAPMPYAIFFQGGYAIHGTSDLRRLGRPASHGCIRLHPQNAATFFALVSEVGRVNTDIVITR